jgi:rhodanese-related sulfurtransferase
MKRMRGHLVMEAALLAGLAILLGLGINRFRTDPLPRALPRSYYNLESGARPILLAAAHRIYEGGSSQFLDARAPQEYEVAQIDGALNVPLDRWEELYGEVHSWIDGQRIVLYATGSDVSLADDLAGALISKGSPRDSVFVYLGGIEEWKAAGYATRSGPDPVLGGASGDPGWDEDDGEGLGEEATEESVE